MAAPERPNIIYINGHDMGRYVQPYGYAVETPNIQRFARDAVVFRSAFCMNPTCSPSRAALLTGMTPHSNGMLGLAHLGWSLNDYRQHWAHTFHANGYTSVFTGGQHISSGDGDGMAQNRRIGYDEILEAIGEEAWARRIADYLHEAPADPFCIEIGFSDCHRRGKEAAYLPPGPEDDPRFVRPPTPLPDDPRTRAEFAGFRAMLRRFDHHVGILLDALDSSGLADSTIVVLTTDHGIDFPHMKCTLRDDGTGVFLMIRGPKGGDWRGGKIIDSMVTHLDVFPTLCELTGTPPPPWLQGKSLSPLVSGEATELHEAVFAELNYHAAYQPMRSVRTTRWKYIRRFYDWPTPIPPNQAPCPSREAWEENGWPNREEPREELFDLIFDPGEAHNLAGDDAHAGVMMELRERLDAWMRETDDPLLHGHIPLVEGGHTMAWSESSNHAPLMDADAWNAWLAGHESRPLHRN